MRVRVQGLNKLPPSLKSAAVLAKQSEQEETSCATRDRGQRATVRRVPSAKRTLGVQHQLGVNVFLQHISAAVATAAAANSVQQKIRY